MNTTVFLQNISCCHLSTVIFSTPGKPVEDSDSQVITNRPSNLRRWTSSTKQGLSILQTLPYIPQVLFNSEGAWGKGPRLELEGVSFSFKVPDKLVVPEITDVSVFELIEIGIFWFPAKMLSALLAKARRFTGRSVRIILSKKMAGKLNFGMTLTS